MSDRKAEIKAKLKRLDEERKTRLEAEAEERELAKLEQTLADNTAIADAEVKIGEQGVHIACIATPDGRIVILKRAPYALFREFQEKKDPKTSELEELAEACRHYPDADTFDKIVEEYPGFLSGMTKAILKLSGALQEDAAKK
jgi:hypothetical protein